MEQILKVEDLQVSYNKKCVISDVGFELNKGEILGIVGESGSGKSTIINAVMGILNKAGHIDKGSIFFKGRDIVNMPDTSMKEIRGSDIAMIFQDTKASLCPVRKIGHQIYDTMTVCEKMSRKEAENRISEIMKKISLENPDRILNSYPFELSGGMCQRVGISMAMVMNPSLILADEPTSALDSVVTKQVARELKNIVREYKVSMIVVTHNINLVEFLSDKVLVLEKGIVREYGNTLDVINNPENEYTRELLKSTLRIV